MIDPISLELILSGFECNTNFTAIIMIGSRTVTTLLIITPTLLLQLSALCCMKLIGFRIQFELMINTHSAIKIVTI